MFVFKWHRVQQSGRSPSAGPSSPGRLPVARGGSWGPCVEANSAIPTHRRTGMSSGGESPPPGALVLTGPGASPGGPDPAMAGGAEKPPPKAGGCCVVQARPTADKAEEQPGQAWRGRGPRLAGVCA